MGYTSSSTLKTELEAVNSAIIALVSGGAKAYMLGDRQVTKLDLPQLREHRKELERMIDVLDNPKRRVIKTYGVYKKSR